MLGAGVGAKLAKTKVRRRGIHEGSTKSRVAGKGKRLEVARERVVIPPVLFKKYSSPVTGRGGYKDGRRDLYTWGLYANEIESRDDCGLIRKKGDL